MIDWSSGRVRSSEWKMAFELPADQNATPFCLRALLLQSGLRAGGCLNKGSCDRHEPLQRKKRKKMRPPGSRTNAVDRDVMNTAASQWENQIENSEWNNKPAVRAKRALRLGTGQGQAWSRDETTRRKSRPERSRCRTTEAALRSSTLRIHMTVGG